MKAKGNTIPIRCAIYTRKSTEEGLEQAFNSLDAQREACEAYAVSQRHEGWQVLSTRYDDGGFSGGNLNRPALQTLLSDIKEGKVDLVLVYKIDRLTRSLMDFSKVVEIFDQYHASFVSVTQHFNTTSSMGRLTLNVLLSFAQFEREVTGERIRDKFAASKRKGIWMGGPVPLGYSLVDKALTVNEKEADLVRTIFERYCVLGCVRALEEELNRTTTRGRSRLHRNGVRESRAFSRGGLYAILNRRLYVGETTHKGESFEGQHEAIVSPELWARAQDILQQRRHQRRTGKRAFNISLLAGMVVDGAGNRLIPTHTTKGDKRYRYYITRSSAQEQKRICLPAHDVERITTDQWLQLLAANDLDVQLNMDDASLGAKLRANATSMVKGWRSMETSKKREVLLQANARIIVTDRRIELSFEPHRLSDVLLTLGEPQCMRIHSSENARVTKAVDARIIKTAGETRVIEDEANSVERARPPAHKTLLKAIAQGRGWAKLLMSGEINSAEEISKRTGLSSAHVARGLKCLTIPPAVLEQLVAGQADQKLTWSVLRRRSTTSQNED
jgi:site-specific DNA recombinase